jgi:hypothetical protein
MPVTLADLQETHQAIKEALGSSALPSPGGLAYLRELRAKAAAQGAEVERRATERGNA